MPSVSGFTYPNDYRDYLRVELEKRTQRDSRYSLNRFAKDLGLVPSRLSEILSGKQGMSREIAERIAGHLVLNPSETEHFCDLVESEHARSAEGRALAKIRLSQREVDESYLTLQMDAFHIISDWYHFAIVQLLELPKVKNDPAAIAKALNITRAEADAAISRLLRMELIEESRGYLHRTKDFVASPDGIPSSAIKKFHSQILAKANAALSEQSVENRNFSANFMTINKEDIPKAKESLKRFRRRFIKEFTSNPEKNAVYCVSTQFFELTHNPETK